MDKFEEISDSQIEFWVCQKLDSYDPYIHGPSIAYNILVHWLGCQFSGKTRNDNQASIKAFQENRVHPVLKKMLDAGKLQDEDQRIIGPRPYDVPYMSYLKTKDMV